MFQCCVWELLTKSKKLLVCQLRGSKSRREEVLKMNRRLSRHSNNEYSHDFAGVVQL